MKPTHLKTLSARIDELEQLRILNGLSFEEFTRLALDANKQSKEKVTLAHFVPCDKNGVPLRNPTNRVILDWCDKAQDDQIAADKKEYNEAQKSVIFEGWEVIQSNKIHHHNVFNSELGLQIEFYKEKESLIRIWDTIGDIELTIIQSLADLAAATQSNPIKLK